MSSSGSHYSTLAFTPGWKLALLLAALVACGCREPQQKGSSTKMPNFKLPNESRQKSEDAAMSYDPQGAAKPAATPDKQREKLLAIDGVEGTGIGQNAIGEENIIVYVRDSGVAARVPIKIGGVDVEVIVTGIVEASKKGKKGK